MADRKLSSSVSDFIFLGMNGLYKQAVELLKILYSNGATDVSFSNASCNIEKCDDSFSFAYLFHYGLWKLLELKRTGDCKPCADNIPLDNLIKVIDQNKDIAEKLLELTDNKQETAYVIQLAHHLLVPLSQKKVYKMDYHSKNQRKECICCNDKISGAFDDTSMGF